MTVLFIFLFYFRYMSPQARFDKSTTDVMKLPQEPDNTTKLRLYGLYKQVRVTWYFLGSCSVMVSFSF